MENGFEPRSQKATKLSRGEDNAMVWCLAFAGLPWLVQPGFLDTAFALCHCYEQLQQHPMKLLLIRVVPCNENGALLVLQRTVICTFHLAK